VWQKLLHQVMRCSAVIGTLALNERDRARQSRAVAGADAPD
jgi:hypothetical protein